MWQKPKKKFKAAGCGSCRFLRGGVRLFKENFVQSLSMWETPQ